MHDNMSLILLVNLLGVPLVLPPYLLRKWHNNETIGISSSDSLSKN